MTIDTSQNVGIGTTSPQSKLMSQPTGAFTAAGTISNAGLNLTSSTTTGGLAGQSIVWSNYGTSGSAVQAYISACTYGSNFMTFSSTGSSEAMRIDSSGNFLVKKTAFSASADNNVGAQLAATGKCIFEVSGDRALILNRLSDNGIIQEFFRGAGNQVGNINAATSSVAYNTSSDYRLKKDIAPMTGALAKVTQLKPVTYKWKVDGEEGQGFIAHELQEVVPDCVTGAKDAVDADGNPSYQGIDTSFLVATLTAAIQELKTINDTQAETINALTARIVALETA
jgi:hypothetical protein